MEQHQVRLRSGRELRRLYHFFNPFVDSGQGVTLLASNSNYPNELQTNAFVQAAAGSDSPMIVQYSYTSVCMEGGDRDKMKLDIPRLTPIRPSGLGARQAHFLLEKYATLYGADMLFMALDHFTSPGIDKVTVNLIDNSEVSSELGSVEYAVAEARVRHAANFIRPDFGEGAEEEISKCTNYLLSPGYRSYKKDFLDAVRFGNPAWAMIDTGGLPVILNFATTKDIIDAVRNELNNHDVMLEAEISATGQSGEQNEYTYWRDLPDRLRRDERKRALSFVQYTGADAIAYEIGMEHAAKVGEVHEPDEDKLREIQQTLWLTGRFIPFAQHGGTGSSKVLQGLVGKYNVNTLYLAAAARAELERCSSLREKIRGREKKAIGTDRFLDEIKAVRSTALEYLEATGTLGLSQRFREVLGETRPESEPYRGVDIEATE